MSSDRNRCLPLVHLNGTSREMLISGYLEALNALRVARLRFGAIEFNARDYYPRGPDSFPEARSWRELQHDRLEAVQQYLEEHLEHLTK